MPQYAEQVNRVGCGRHVRKQGTAVLAALALAGCGMTSETETAAVGVITGALGVNSLSRPSDPVVLKGSSLSPLLGVAPGDIVAFRYSVPSLRLYYEGSGMTVTQAQQRDGWTRSPLTASAASF